LRQHPLLPLAREMRYAKLPEAHARAADAVRQQIDRVLGGAESSIDVRIEHGIPHVVIVEQAEALRTELIVVGAAPSSVGSKAERVVRYAHCPVLVARSSPASGIVLVATDLSDKALPAVAAGVDQAQRRRIPLALLHVVDLRPFMAQPDFGAAVAIPLTDELRESLLASARDRLSKALRRFRGKGELLVEAGDPTSVIVEQAARLGASLLVLGTAGTTGLKRMVLGSVAEAVLRRASCSTLVVRKGEEGKPRLQRRVRFSRGRRRRRV
jgi:nucleotide-binding universal stress UspA family protein